MPVNNSPYNTELYTLVQQHESVAEDLLNLSKLSTAVMSLFFGNGVVLRDALEAIMSTNVTGWPMGGLIPTMGSLGVTSVTAIPSGPLDNYEVEIEDGMVFVDGYSAALDASDPIVLPKSTLHLGDQIPLSYNVDPGNASLHETITPGTRELFGFKQQNSPNHDYFTYLWDSWIQEDGFSSWLAPRQSSGMNAWSSTYKTNFLTAVWPSNVLLIYMGNQTTVDLTTLQSVDDLETGSPGDLNTPCFFIEGGSSHQFTLEAFPTLSSGPSFPGLIRNSNIPGSPASDHLVNRIVNGSNKFTAVYQFDLYTINSIMAGYNVGTSQNEFITEQDVLDPVIVADLQISRPYGYLPLYVYQLVDFTGDGTVLMNPITKMPGLLGDARLGIRTAV